MRIHVVLVHMYRVLMPVDRSEDRSRGQVEAVNELARETESLGVWILHVFDDGEEAASTKPTDLDTGGLAEEALLDAGARVETMSRTGDATDEILQAARDMNADMILLGGRKRSQLGSLVFGSVSQSVTLEATLPVVVTGSAEEGERVTHRCESCGETYSARRSTQIDTCRSCGGTSVEAL